MSDGLTKAVGVFKEFGSAVNTVLIIGAAVGLIWKWGADREATDREIADNARAIIELRDADSKRWDGHHQLHKDRLADVKEKEGAWNEWRQTIEQQIRKIDNVDYRVTVLEQARQADAAIVRDVQKTVNDLAGDVKVVRELLQRGSQRTAGEL